MASTPKRTRATLVKHTAITGIQSFLQALPEKTTDDLSLKEAVTVLQEPLQAALAKGYTYPDLATLLTNTGIPISPFTLKNYVPIGKRGGKGRAKPMKVHHQAMIPVAANDQLAPTATAAPAIATSQITPETPTETPLKRRGKATRTTTMPAEVPITPAAPTQRRGKAKAAPTETAAKTTAGAGKSAKASTRKKPSATSAAKQITPTRTKSSKTRKKGKSDT